MTVGELLEQMTLDEKIVLLTGAQSMRTGSCELGDAIGKPGRMAAAITDPRMAERIIELSTAGETGES